MPWQGKAQEDKDGEKDGIWGKRAGGGVEGGERSYN